MQKYVKLSTSWTEVSWLPRLSILFICMIILSVIIIIITKSAFDGNIIVSYKEWRTCLNYMITSPVLNLIFLFFNHYIYWKQIAQFSSKIIISFKIITVNKYNCHDHFTTIPNIPIHISKSITINITMAVGYHEPIKGFRML